MKKTIFRSNMPTCEIQEVLDRTGPCKLYVDCRSNHAVKIDLNCQLPFSDYKSNPPFSSNCRTHYPTHLLKCWISITLACNLLVGIPIAPKLEDIGVRQILSCSLKSSISRFLEGTNRCPSCTPDFQSQRLKNTVTYNLIITA